MSVIVVVFFWRLVTDTQYIYSVQKISPKKADTESCGGRSLGALALGCSVRSTELLIADGTHEILCLDFSVSAFPMIVGIYITAVKVFSTLAHTSCGGRSSGAFVLRSY